MNQKQKANLFNALLAFVVVVGFCSLVYFSTNSDQSKAIQKCQQQVELGNVCSGYHYEKGEGKYYIYFRDSKTNEITKIVETISKNVVAEFYKGE